MLPRAGSLLGLLLALASGCVYDMNKRQWPDGPAGDQRPGGDRPHGDRVEPDRRLGDLDGPLPEVDREIDPNDVDGDRIPNEIDPERDKPNQLLRSATGAADFTVSSGSITMSGKSFCLDARGGNNTITTAYLTGTPVGADYVVLTKLTEQGLAGKDSAAGLVIREVSAGQGGYICRVVFTADPLKLELLSSEAPGAVKDQVDLTVAKGTKTFRLEATANQGNISCREISNPPPYPEAAKPLDDFSQGGTGGFYVYNAKVCFEYFFIVAVFR